MRLGPSDCLLITDVQYALLTRITDSGALIEGLQAIMTKSSEDGATIVATQDWRGDLRGARIGMLHEELPHDAVTVFLRRDSEFAASAFSTTGLSGLLKERGIKTVYTAGVAYVQESACDAQRAGFRSVILEDLTRSPLPQMSELFLTHGVFVSRSDLS